MVQIYNYTIFTYMLTAPRPSSLPARLLCPFLYLHILRGRGFAMITCTCS